MADRAHLERLTKELVDKGLLLEAGWVSLRLAAIPLNASALQLDEMHKAYMAGAQHLWASIIAVLDPGSEPTDADMARLSAIDAELRAFGDKLIADLPVAGRG